MLVTPEYLFCSVQSITPDFLKKHGIRALVLDVDNTLTAHGSQVLPPEVEQWLNSMRTAKIQLMIASNNSENRVKPFAEKIGLDFVAMSCKPLTYGLARARKKFGVEKSAMAIVGDQLFTDRLAGAFYGIKALVVEPCGEELNWGVKVKRVLERPFLKKFHRRGGKIQ